MAEDKNKTVVVKPLAKAFLTTKPEDNESPVDRPVQKKSAAKPQKTIPKASEVAKQAAAAKEEMEKSVAEDTAAKENALVNDKKNKPEDSKVKKTEAPAKDVKSAKKEEKAESPKKTAEKPAVKETKVKKAEKTEKVESAKKPAVKSEKKEKAEPAKKEPVKKPEPAKKTAEKPAAKSAAKTEKKEPAQSIIIQYQNDSYNQAELVATAEKIWTKDMKKKASDLKSLELYIKPQEKMVYCVYNKKVTHSFAI